MDLELIQKTVGLLNLEDDDIIHNVYMPTSICQCCGGFGIVDWNENKPILCMCLLETKDERINYGLLKRLSTITKSEVYDG